MPGAAQFDGMQLAILLPAFAAGLLVLATHVPLGAEVLKRGIIFIDLAIAQIAGLGIVVAHALDVEVSRMAGAGCRRCCRADGCAVPALG